MTSAPRRRSCARPTAFVPRSSSGVGCWRAPATSRRWSSSWRSRTTPSWPGSSRPRLAALERDFATERTALLFSGEYDERNALLTISAGAGGTEATDWAEMLLRMYLRWAERHRFRTEILDRQEGEQAGLKSVIVTVEGRRAYGWLRAERGVHRLVRISPYDAQKRRQTTFALVEVLPEVEDAAEIELDWDEIRVDTFRSQGAGGQHVNKTDSAVRLTHLPTGIVAQSQNERSQTQNKEMAIKVLTARLLERALEEKEAELRVLRGEHVEAGWGNQIRSYVLHPYQMVKDLRTEHETSNTGAVLDGDLDAFMSAELERLATGKPPSAGRRGRVSAPAEIRYRPATEADLPACEATWRDAPERLSRPARAVRGPARQPVAPRCSTPTRSPRTRSASGSRRAAARRRRRRRTGAAATARSAWSRSPRRSGAGASGSCRCSSSGPASRGPGSGGRSSARVLPPDGDGAVLATVADTAQPISNGLYASFGIVPRMPMFNLVGRPSRPEALAQLPAGVHAVRFDATAPAERDRLLDAELGAAGPRDPRRRPPGRPRLPPPPGSDRVRLPGRPGRPARLRLRVRGRPDRADRDARSRAPRPDRRPPPGAPSCPAGRRPSGYRAPPGRPRRCSSGRGSGSRASRCSSAGRARSPTSAATCRSRPACSEPAGRPARRAGAAVVFAPSGEPVVASGGRGSTHSARVRSPAQSRRHRSDRRRTEPRSRS